VVKLAALDDRLLRAELAVRAEHGGEVSRLEKIDGVAVDDEGGAGGADLVEEREEGAILPHEAVGAAAVAEVEVGHDPHGAIRGDAADDPLVRAVGPGIAQRACRGITASW